MMPAQRHELAVTLGSLLKGVVNVGPVYDGVVADICEDSRQVGERTLFIARQGAAHDATQFAADVAAARASAMMFEGEGQPFVDEGGLLRVPVPDLAKAAGTVAHRFFGAPSARLRVIAITGTNAKSSVAHHVATAAGELSGHRCATIGTLGAGLLPVLSDTGLTTPDCVSVHRALARFVEAGAGYVTIEASSHALQQGRLDGVQVDTAVFTNLSRDHLDYHGDMAAYTRAKLRLVEQFSPRALVLNADDPASRKFRAAIASATERLDFSLKGALRAGVKGKLVAAGRDGVTIEVAAKGRTATLCSPLLGRLSAQNLIASLAVLLVNGFELEPAVDALAKVPSVRGRLEAIDLPGAPLVVIDYAHTPAALENALTTLRPLCAGQLWCVFGAGGDRDPGKRPLMGRVVARHADRAVVTDDNPRHEDGHRIVHGVMSGVTDRARKRFDVIRDRRAAIAQALGAADAADVVLIAGKGHETYQRVADELLPFDDAEVVREWFTEHAPC